MKILYVEDSASAVLVMRRRLSNFGHEVVLAQRVSRDADTWAKRRSAEWFYAIHNKKKEA
jgi:CheY-like chemotaxis protein